MKRWLSPEMRIKQRVKQMPGVVISLVALTLGVTPPGRSQQVALDFTPPSSTTSVTGSRAIAVPARATPSAVNFTPQPSQPLRPIASPPRTIATRRQTSRPGATATRIARQVELFAGGSNSLVARTVGHAEGTRSVEGGKTRAYRGHTDPGNGVWNLGSFSFQHCQEAAYQCSKPEEADVYQLRRLQQQSQSILYQANRAGLQLTTVEHLNGIDLANQAPLAALGNPGYVALLQDAQTRGLQGEEAVLWARLYSYWNPQTQSWDAPGLGNTSYRIRADQYRRMSAISAALNFYLQENSGG